MGLHLGQELGQAFGIDRCSLPSSAAPQFGGGQFSFALRVPMQLGVILGDALDPAMLDKRVGHPQIKGVIPDRHLGPFYLRVAQRVVPLGDVMELDATPPPDLGGPVVRAGTGEHQEGLIVGDAPVLALSALRQPGLIGIQRTLAQGRVFRLVVHLLCPLPRWS